MACSLDTVRHSNGRVVSAASDHASLSSMCSHSLHDAPFCLLVVGRPGASGMGRRLRSVVEYALRRSVVTALLYCSLSVSHGKNSVNLV